jgi:cytochrome c oxidase assembly factor CtaG/cytochrome c2
MYARGMRVQWNNAPDARVRLRRSASLFAAGFALLVIALVSPLHRLGTVLFSAHMAQHEILMTLAAPILVLSRPLFALLWSVPIETRKSIGGFFSRSYVHHPWRVLSRPAVATAIHAVAIWGWHIPGAYNASVNNEWVHAAQHASFLGTALLFWWAMLNGRRGNYGLAVIYVFLTATHTTVLGAFLTMSNTAWYSAYSIQLTSAWGLTPLEDQQLGGLIMWVPATVAYLVAALCLFAGWLRESEVRVLTRENVARAAVLLLLFAIPGCSGPDTAHAAGLMVGGNADRGVKAIRKYGCGSCHTIPGIREAHAKVGPNLDGIAGRSYIGGVIGNTPENMMTWIENPQAVDNKTAMPNMGVTERDARDIATYLYTLK